jgi:hypothetical protein
MQIRPRKYWTALLLLFGVGFTVSLVRFGPQLIWRVNLWWLTGSWELPEGGLAVPLSTHPETAIPPDFVKCRLGPVEVRVPPTIGKPEFRGGALPCVVLRDDNRILALGLPRDNRKALEAIRTELAECGGLNTVPRLEAEAYATRPADFRWSMSRQEFARHRWLLRYRGVVPVQAVETWLDGEVEGLLLTLGHSAVFEWIGADGAASGVIIFEHKHGVVDLTWVRPICASLRYSGGVFGETTTADEAAKLFRID